MRVHLKRNLAVTYGSQLFMALVGIVMLPFYVRILGVEAYGIIGLYIALQAWLALLDFGLSSTLSREATRFRAGVAGAAETGNLLRFVEWVFLLLGMSLAAAIIVGAKAITLRWLQSDALGHSEIVTAVRLIGVVIALRFLAIPYRAVLTGLEDLAWLGFANVFVTTLRSIIVVTILWSFGATLPVFFTCQIAIGVLEVGILSARARNKLPITPSRLERLTVIKRHWRYSLSLAAVSAIWVAATSTDKVLLSGLLSLQDYALFSIASTAAGGVLLVSGPFAIVFGPRIINLHAKGDRDGLVHMYGTATQLTLVTAVPAGFLIALFSKELIWAWTGDVEIAAKAARVLTLYTLGNCLLAIGGLPLHLQIAAGRLRLHILGTLLFVASLLPFVWYATSTWGMEGAGAAWLAVNALYVIGWVPVAHYYFLPQSHWLWLTRRVVVILLPTAVCGLLIRSVLPWPENRWLVLAQLLVVGFALLLVASTSADTVRGNLPYFLRKGGRV
jgi:O-antigen/teichoic acid export membrane protein